MRTPPGSSFLRSLCTYTSIALPTLAPLAQVRDELVLGHETPGAAQENLEQADLARRQLERLAVKARDTADLVG